MLSTRRRLGPAWFAVLLLSATAMTAAAETRTAQLGGGFEASIRCDGSRLSYQRRDARSVRLLCRPGTPRSPDLRNVGLESVDLQDGEEMRLLCQGGRLTTRRTSRSEMRASCAEII